MNRRTKLVALVLQLALQLALPSVRTHAQGFRLKVQAPAIPLVNGSEFDAAVHLDASTDGVQGWSFGVGHDDTSLQLVGAADGTATLTGNGGSAAEFIVLDSDPAGGAGVTHAVVLNLEDPAVVLPAGDDQQLLTIRYGVLADPTMTEACAVMTGIDLTGELGAPSVSTVVTVGGENAAVELMGATVTVACPLSNVITRCEAVDKDVILGWDFGSASPAEIDFVFVYRDGAQIALIDDGGSTSFTDVGVAGGVHDYTLFTIAFDDAGDPVLLFTHCSTLVTPVAVTGVDPAAGDWSGGDLITITGTTFTSAATTSLVLFADGVELPLEIVEISSESELTARTPEAPALGIYGIRLQNEVGAGELPGSFEYGLRRGRINSDTTTDISDVISLLEFLFLGAGTPPQCTDAADVNDDGNLDVSDAGALLDYLFKGGAAPQAPFDEAGADPTDDALGCLE